jgi:hypothetical protein
MKRISFARRDIFLVCSALIGIALLVSSTYFVIVFTASKEKSSISVTTVALAPAPLNYSAYQIERPGAGRMILSFSFGGNSGSGDLNLTSFAELSNVAGNASGLFAIDCLANGSAIKNFCGVSIVPGEPEINYYPYLYTTVPYAITANNDSLSGPYLFYTYGGCNWVFLVVGDNIPKTFPFIMGCVEAHPIINVTISVIGIDNLTGLNSQTN